MMDIGMSSNSQSSSCCFCLTPKGPCGLFPINFDTKQLLTMMYGIQIEDDDEWTICVSCLRAMEKASDFGEMIKRSTQLMREVQSSVVCCDVKQEDFFCWEQDSADDVGFDIQFEAAENAEIRSDFNLEYQEETEELVDVKLMSVKLEKVPKKRKRNPKMKSHVKSSRDEKGYAHKVKHDTWVCCGVNLKHDALQAHRRAAHPWLMKKRNCPICHAEFDGQIAIRRHMNEEHIDLSCNVCEKQFPNVRKLRGHQVTCRKENNS